MTAPGWYNAAGDPPGTQRYWDGDQWVGEPVHAQTGPPPPPAGSAGNHGPLGSPGARIGARILDFLIMVGFAIALTLAGVLGSDDDVVVETGDGGFEFSYDQTFDSSLSFLVWGLVAWAWAFGWTHLKGGTPGKLILGMKVADEATGSSPVGVQQALVRTGTAGLALLGVLGTGLGNLSAVIGFLVGLVSLILLFSDDKHRTVMDRIAKTVVVK